jgi:hypothetical protein
MMKASASQKMLIVGSACPPVALERHEEVAEGQQHRPEQHRLALAQVRSAR